MKRKPRLSKAGAKIVGALRDFAEALETVGDLSRRFTIRTVELDLEPHVFSPSEIRAVRDQLGLSQPLFARFLGASVQTVRSWEQGSKTPSPIAARFLEEIARSPEYWQARLRESLRPGSSRKAPSG
jgi:putative transcriptional regulator